MNWCNQRHESETTNKWKHETASLVCCLGLVGLVYLFVGFLYCFLFRCLFRFQIVRCFVSASFVCRVFVSLLISFSCLVFSSRCFSFVYVLNLGPKSRPARWCKATRAQASQAEASAERDIFLSESRCKLPDQVWPIFAGGTKLDGRSKAWILDSLATLGAACTLQSW